MSAEPTKSLGEMLAFLVRRHRELAVAKGLVIHTPSGFDAATKRNLIEAEDESPGHIEAAYRKALGGSSDSKRTVTEVEKAAGLCVELLANGGWTEAQILGVLADDGVSPVAARRALTVARPIAAEEVRLRAARREVHEAELAKRGGPAPSRPEPRPIRELRSVDLPAYALADQPPADDDAFTSFHADHDEDPEPTRIGDTA